MKKARGMSHGLFVLRKMRDSNPLPREGRSLANCCDATTSPIFHDVRLD